MTSIIEKRRSLHKDLAYYKKENRRLNEQLAHLQALANIGKTSAMVAHEVNNLLTPLGNYASLALKNPEDKKLTRKALRKAVQQCESASQIMQSLLTAANDRTQQKTSLNFQQLLKKVFHCLARDFSKDRINVDLDIPEKLTVYAVPIQLQQTMMNLILNARDAMLDRGGTLKICARSTPSAVEIEITDTGCGIKPGNLENIFEPFFSTKEDNPQPGNSGSGLGLSFCKSVVDAHGGSISVSSVTQKGTSFRMIFPHPRKK